MLTLARTLQRMPCSEGGRIDCAPASGALRCRARSRTVGRPFLRAMSGNPCRADARVGLGRSDRIDAGEPEGFVAGAAAAHGGPRDFMLAAKPRSIEAQGQRACWGQVRLR